MKKMTSPIVLSLLLLCGSSALGQGLIGEECSYDDYPGACEIVSILKTEESIHQAEVCGGPGYEGYEVSFVFSPEEPMNLTEDWENLVFGGEHLLQLFNSWYPGPRFLEKYNITEGAVFDCTLKLIAGGTCSPIIFEFDDIDRCDYFESSGSEEWEDEGEEGEAEGDEGLASETVKIGAIYPLSGSLASSGEEMKRGILLAVEVINGQHDLDLPLARSKGIVSLGGARIEVVFGDSQGDPAAGRSEAERLISEESVVALLGAYQSSVTAAASEVAEAEGRPFLTAASTAPSLTERGFNWFFRTTPDEEIFVQNFYQFLADLQKSQPSEDNETLRLAFVHEDSIWGEEFGDLAERYGEDQGFEIVADVSYYSGDPDLTDEVQELVEADPDIVMQASYTEDAILYMQTYRAMNFTPKAILADDAGFSDPEFLNVLGGDVDYVLTRATWSLDLAEKKPPAENVSQLFEKQYGIEMDEESARAFTATIVLASAIERARSLDSEAIRTALLETNLSEDEIIMLWDGVEFDPETYQNIRGRGIICQIIGQEYRTVWPFDLASEDLVVPMFE